MQPISLCIALLNSSKIFKNFVETNNLGEQLKEIAMNSNNQGNDIAKMLNTILNQLDSQLQGNLKDQIHSIFGINQIKKITVSQKRKLFRKSTPDNIQQMYKTSNVMKLNIRNEDNRPLGTIENVFNNAFESKSQKEKGTKISTTRIIEKMPDVLIIQYERFNNTSPHNKLQEDVKCNLEVNFNNTPYNLKGVIVHKGDNIDNENYIGIFSNIQLPTTYNNIYTIEEIQQNQEKLQLINQADLLLFERSAPVSPPTPIITEDERYLKIMKLKKLILLFMQTNDARKNNFHINDLMTYIVEQNYEFTRTYVIEEIAAMDDNFIITQNGEVFPTF